MKDFFMVFIPVFFIFIGYVLGVGIAFKYPEWHYEFFIDKSKPYPFKTDKGRCVEQVAVRYKDGCVVDSVIVFKYR